MLKTKEMKQILKKKKILLASWNISNQDYYQNRDWIPLFKKLFDKVITFSPRDYYFKYGKKLMNKLFLEIVSKEKPNFILFCLNYDEFYFETLQKIKELSPKTITLNFFGDDMWRYDDWSRHYALFFDYNITTEIDNSAYRKDGITNALFLYGINSEIFKPFKTDKKYDVTFIGMPIRDRYEYIKYLKDNNVNIKLFGKGWDKYKDFKDIYQGFISLENYAKIANQTKINISFSKGAIPSNRDTQLKGRTLEVPACNSFLLMEDFSGANLFFKNKNLRKVIFKDKQELLRKVKYYLKHEKSRKGIAREFYKEVLKKYEWKIRFNNFFEKVISKEKTVSHKQLPKLNKKIKQISETEITLSLNELKKRLKDIDYVNFRKGKYEELPLKNYFQARSLEKSKRQISCCDYYVYSKLLSDYLLFMAKKAFNNISSQDFRILLNINQLMVTKKYFLEHLKEFKKFFEGDSFNLINKLNTIFVSIPLIRIYNLNNVDYSSMNEAFRMRFLDNLYADFYQKRIVSTYLYKIILATFLGKTFILRNILENLSKRRI